MNKHIFLSCSHRWQTARGGGRCIRGKPSACLVPCTSSDLSADSCSPSPPWLSQHGCLATTSPATGEPRRCPPCSKYKHKTPAKLKPSFTTMFTWFQMLNEHNIKSPSSIHVPKCENGGVVKISRETWTPHHFLHLTDQKNSISPFF